MEMKQSDILDRWTILRIKSKYDANAEKEMALFDKELTDLINKDCENARPGERPRVFSLTFMGLLCDLMEANSRIWENEAAIRNEYDKDPANVWGGSAPQGGCCGKTPGRLQLEEIGRRSMLIREYNAKRVKAKSQIDILFGKIPDVKINHISSGTSGKSDVDMDGNPHDVEEWDIYIRDVPDQTKKIAVIRSVREITGMGLKDAKDLVDLASASIPQLVHGSLVHEGVMALKTKLEQAGALVEIRRAFRADE
jgi:ribosomal protein L7/L12